MKLPLRATLRTLHQYAATAHGRHDLVDDARAVLLVLLTIIVALALCFVILAPSQRELSSEARLKESHNIVDFDSRLLLMRAASLLSMPA